MVNYRGPKRQWTDAEKKELETKPHSIGEENGIVIVEELPFTPKSKMWQDIEAEAKELTDNRNGSRPFPKTIFDVDKDDEQ